MDNGIERAIGKLQGNIDELLRLAKDSHDWQQTHEVDDNKRFSRVSNSINNLQTSESYKKGEQRIIAAVFGGGVAVAFEVVKAWIKGKGM